MNPFEWQEILSTVSTLVGLVVVVWAVLRFVFRGRWEEWKRSSLEELRAPLTTQIDELRVENGQQHEAAEESRAALAERVGGISSTVDRYHRENQHGHRVMLRKLLGREQDEAAELLDYLEEDAIG